MALKLAYNKFLKVANQNKYSIVTVFYVNEDVKKIIFMEARLPKTQKSIMVNIPSKFTMSLPDDISARKVEIVFAGKVGGSDDNNTTENNGDNGTPENKGLSNAAILSEASVKYLLDIRGPLIESDLLAISASGLCYSKFSGELQYYFLASNIPTPEESLLEEEGEPVDEITLLQKEIRRVARRKGLKLKPSLPIQTEEEATKEAEDVDEQIAERNAIEIETHHESADETGVNGSEKDSKANNEEANETEANEEEINTEKNPSEHNDTPKEKDENIEKEKVELVFEKSDENPVKEEEYPVENIDLSELKKPPKEISAKSPLGLAHGTNYVFPEEVDVYLGLIYVAADVSTICKEFNSFEAEALSIFEQIDENERELRVSRINEIKKNIALAIQHLDLRIKAIEVDERKLKYQLLRLTTVLRDAEDMRDRAIEKFEKSFSKTDSKKDGSKTLITNETILDIDRVYNNARKMAHEINIQLLKNKDNVEEIISNYELSIEEFFEL